MAHILFHFDKQYVCLHCHLWFYTRRTVLQHATHFHSRIAIPFEDPSAGNSQDQVEDPLIEEPLVDEQPFLIDLPPDEYVPFMDATIAQPVYQPGSPFFEPPTHFLDPSAILLPLSTASPVKEQEQGKNKDKKKKQSPAASRSKPPHAFPCSLCRKSFKTSNGLIHHEKNKHGIMRPPPATATSSGASDTAQPAIPIAVPVLVPEIVNGENGSFVQLIPMGSETIEIVASGSNETCEVQPAKPKRRRTTGVILPRRPKAAPSISGTSSNPRRKTTSTGGARAVKPRPLKTLSEQEDQEEKKKKRASTINGWVEGKVHHKEHGINNRMLHERAKADQEEAEGIVRTRKLYCKNSRWKKLEEEREEEERKRLQDPKLAMKCFVQLTDIFQCHVHLQEEERNGMLIYR